MGEPVWETGARPFEHVLEFTNRTSQKVYRPCKGATKIIMLQKAIVAGGCFWGEPVWETGARGCLLFFKIATACTVPVRNKIR